MWIALLRAVTKVSIGIAWCVLIAFHVPLASGQFDDFGLATGRAGPIEVGMSVEEVYDLIGRERVRLVDLAAEEMFTPAIEIDLDGSPISPSLTAPIREWPCTSYSVQGIRVFDPRFRTAEDVGVGSTLADLREQYELILSDEGGPHAWVEPTLMNFGLENRSRGDDVRVVSLWLPGDPAEVERERCPDRGRIGPPG